MTLLTPEDLARGDLGRFDAIVTGVRAYNVRPDLSANQQRLLDYVQQRRHAGGAVQHRTGGRPLARTRALSAAARRARA